VDRCGAVAEGTRLAAAFTPKSPPEARYQGAGRAPARGADHRADVVTSGAESNHP